MKRSIFMGGNFNGMPGHPVKPITLAINSYDIPQDELVDVLKHALPSGWTGTSPQVIKTLDGEYLVYASGSIEFVPLGRAPQQVSPGLQGARKELGDQQDYENACAYYGYQTMDPNTKQCPPGTHSTFGVPGAGMWFCCSVNEEEAAPAEPVSPEPEVSPAPTPEPEPAPAPTGETVPQEQIPTEGPVPTQEPLPALPQEPVPSAAPSVKTFPSGGPIPVTPTPAVPTSGPTSPFQQTVYPCGPVPYQVPDLATVTQPINSLSDFDQRYRWTW